MACLVTHSDFSENDGCQVAPGPDQNRITARIPPLLNGSVRRSDIRDAAGRKSGDEASEIVFYGEVALDRSHIPKRLIRRAAIRELQRSQVSLAQTGFWHQADRKSGE